MPKRAYFRTGRLLAINLRRDWLKMTIWMLVMAGLFASVAFKFNDLYGTKTAIAQIITTLKTPAMISLFGRLPSGPYTTADIFASEMTVFMAIFGAIMNFSFAVSLTRGDEDSGVTELVSAHAVGPYATLTAAIAELLVLNGTLALLYSFGLQFAGLRGTDTAGNFVLGIGLGLNGLMFGVLAILLAQLVESSRAATGLSYAIFGLVYLSRMVTDVSHPKYTWLSPLGWVEKFQTYRQNNWLPALFMLIASAIFIGGAILLRSHRDLNAGIIATRPGRKTASFMLQGPIGLFWRLERNTIFIWVIGMFLFAAMYGSVFDTVAGILKTNPLTMRLLADPHAAVAAQTQILKSFIAMLMIIFAVVSAIPGIQIINRLVGDEKKGFFESLHARPISRLRLNGILTCLGLLTSTITLAASVAGLEIAANSVLKHPLATKLFVHAFTANLAPMLIMVAISVCLVGWLPRLTALNWGYLGLAFGVGYFGRLLDLPNWATKLTPFGFIGRVPAVAVQWPTFWWQLGIALVIVIVGLVGYLHRDIDAAN